MVSRKCLSVSAAKDKFTMEDCSREGGLSWQVQNYNQTLIEAEL